MALIDQLDAKIYDALITRLKTMSGGYDIVEPGDTYPTAANAAFIVAQDIRFEPNPRYVGDMTPDEHTGTLNLSIMVPLSWTHGQLLGVAGLVRDHMPKSLRLYGDGFSVEILRTPFVLGASQRDKSWHRLEVQVRWRCSG
jgi:hypothetical protein